MSRTPSHRALLAATLAVASMSAHAGDLLVLSKVVEQGDPAPGFDDVGFLFEAFGNHPVFVAEAPPRIDNLGNVSFHAYVGEDGLPDDTAPFGASRGFFRMVDGELGLVVKVGDPAPGVNAMFAGFPGPDFFAVGSTPWMHDGKITFPATATDNVFLGGLWSERFRPPGILEFILRDEETLPGTPPGQVVHQFVSTLRAQTILVNAKLSPSIKDNGLWRNETGSFEVIANRGMPAPGTGPGVFFDAFTSLAFFGTIHEWDANLHGEVIFNGYLGRESAVCGNGICEPFDGENCLNCPDDCNGQQSGNPALRFCCGNGAGENPVDCDDPRCSIAGFMCESQASADIDELNDEGIWIDNQNGLQLIVREGDPAPQVAPDASFGAVSAAGLGGLSTFGDADDVQVRINDNGALLFGARVTTPEYFSKSTIWTTRNGELELFLTASRGLPEVPGGPTNQFPGDPAPGLERHNATFRDFIFADQSNAGRIAFIGQVIFNDDPLDVSRGIWLERFQGTELTLIAATGEPVPGVPGAVFTNLQYFTNTNNNWEFVLFLGEYSGPGISQTVGLFRGALDGTVDLLIVPGGSVHIDGAGERTVGSFAISFGQSDSGQRAILLNFTDGTSGIYIASLASPGAAPADLNGDGSVGVADLLVLLAAWGACEDCPLTTCPADLDENCEVDVADLLVLLGNWD